MGNAISSLLRLLPFHAGSVILFIAISINVNGQGLIDGPASLCNTYSGTYTVSGSSATSGYTWSVTNGSIASGQGSKTATITFFGPAIGRTITVTGNGLAATAYVNVYSTYTPTISGPATVCKGGTATYTIAPLTMPWIDRVEFFSPNATEVARTETSITVSFPSNFTSGQIVAYGIFGSCGAGSTAVFNVSATTGAIPPALGEIVGKTTVSPGEQSVTYTVPANGASSYQWTVPWQASVASGANTNSIVLNFNSGFPGGTISVTPSNGSCSGPPSTLTITSTGCSALTAGMITGSAQVCPGQNAVAYSIPAVQGASEYVWTLPNNTQQRTSTPSIVVNFPSTFAGGALKVYPKSAACPQGPISTLTITSQANLRITDPGPVCPGASGNASFTAIVDGTGTNYKWYKNDVLVTDNGPGVPAYAYAPLTPLNAGDRIKATAVITTACVTSQLSTSNVVTIAAKTRITPTVHVQPSLELPAWICAGTGITFTSVPGSSEYSLSNFQWKLNGNTILNVSSNTYTITPFSQGDILTVTATASGACLNTSIASGSTQGYPITVLANPQTPDVSSFNNSTIPYHTSLVIKPATVLNQGETFKWYAANQSTLLSSFPEFHTGQLTSNTTYYVSNANTSCESAKRQVVINVKVLPTVDAGTDKIAALPLSSYILSGSGTTTGTTWAWSKVSGPPVNISNSTVTTSATLTNLTAGTYVFRFTIMDNLGQRVSDDMVLTVTSTSPITYNYEKAETIGVKNIKTLSQVEALTVDQKATSIVYLDELGRKMQSIAYQASPNRSDVVTPQTFDALGRVFKSYLPVFSNGVGNGAYRSVLNANGEYSGSDFVNPYSDKPYAVTNFESTPWSRPIEQGSVGSAWQPGVGNGTTKTSYGANLANIVRLWNINSNGLPQSTTTWAATKLRLTILTTQVSSTKQAVTETYVDGQGLKILQREKVDATNWAETYFVYDGRNNLRFIIPPMLTSSLKTANNFTVTAVQAAEWCFETRYDNRNRPVEAKAPGAEWTYNVFDLRGRTVMVQDGILRSQNEWSYTTYDDLDRVKVEGILIAPAGSSRSSLQSLFDADGAASFLSQATLDPLIINYYDTYSGANFFQDANFQFTPWSAGIGEPFIKRSSAYGLVTGRSEKILDSNNWLNSVIYYDRYDFPIQTVSSVPAGGVSRSSIVHDFSGKTLQQKHEQSGQTILERFEYDHSGRLKKIFHKINSQDEVLLSQLDYNETGQVIDKKIHSANASSFLQSIDYSYNINGWLTSINNPDGADPQDPDDFFAMSFAYETDAFTSVSSPRKDGYITASKWRSSLNYDKLNLYNFDYDNLHRLMGANYRAGKGSTWTTNLDFYSEKGIAYDLNGNITKMKHYDIQVASSGATSAGLVDDLVYGYGTAGNKLLTVSDNGTAAIRGKVFKDGNTTGNDYEYDLNGNLINDKNKKITITYNRYNQPAQVSFSDSSIVYTYSATGAKLSEAVFSGANEISRKEYFGAFIYEKDQSGIMEVSRILHSSGFLLKNAAEFEYYYYLTDQVGSPRVVLRTLPPTVAQTATVEPEELSSEQSEFLRVENVKRVQSALFDKTNNPASGYSVRLNGLVNEKYGLAKTLSVMPGDRVKLEVYAKFVDPQPTNRTTALNTLLSQISAGSTSIVVDGPQYSTSSTSFPFPGLLDKSGSTEEGPKVYLNWLVFDRNFKFLDGGYKRLSNAPRETGQDVAHERLNTELLIKEAGYVYVYYSNENETVLEAYFDDFGVEHIASPVVQINDYYPYGHAYRIWAREGEDELRDKFQGKDLNPKTKLHDFHARQYDATLGRFLGVDPKNQFASGYVGMGNNPVIGVDPDGQWVNFVVGAVIGGVGGYSTGKALGKSGWDLLGYTMAGAGIGAATAGMGSAVTTGTSATLGATGSTLAGGTIAGAFNGAAMAVLGDGDVGQGAMYGAIGGLAGSTASLANVKGIVPGALYGAGTGGLVSGGISSLSGGSFGDGFRSGAISGGIMGGIGGGISAAQSQYERNIWFGGVTRSGKINYINDLAVTLDAYNQGLNSIDYNYTGPGGGRDALGETRFIIDGNEVLGDVAWPNGGEGTKSNVYLKMKGSLRSIESTFRHEFKHVTDMFTGATTRFYQSQLQHAMWRTKIYTEIRAYRVSVEFGYNRNYYRGRLNDHLQAWQTRYGFQFPY